MAAIGDGWADGAWIEASWISGAWAAVAAAVGEWEMIPPWKKHRRIATKQV